ncbi:MAG: hypothetical protein QM820_13315 [Minicystis sp.]
MLIWTPMFVLTLLNGLAAEPSFSGVPRVRRIADALPAVPAQAPLEAVFSCYRRAHDDTRLDGRSIAALCQGAADAGPADCYIRAHRQTFLADEDAIALCRCAASIAPVDCFQTGRGSTTLDTDRILPLCAPVERFQLDETCTPPRR